MVLELELDGTQMRRRVPRLLLSLRGFRVSEFRKALIAASASASAAVAAPAPALIPASSTYKHTHWGVLKLELAGASVVVYL